MAVGDILAYEKWMQAQVDSSTVASNPVDFDSDTLKFIILDNTFTPDVTASSVQEHLDDISAKEVTTGTNYTGAITLTTTSVTNVATVIIFDADDISIAVDTSTGFTNGRYAVIYKDSGVAATSPLILSCDFGADLNLASNTINLNWGASGILTWSKA